MKFSLATGQPLLFTPGLPADHGGPLLNGATASHVKAGFGQIVLQEFSTEKASFRNCMISWKKPEKILCQYQHPPGVFARVALNNRIHEFIKGAGELHLNREQFVTLTGSEWTGLLLAEKPGEYHFIDVAGSADFLKELINDTTLNDALESSCNRFPQRLSGPAYPVSMMMTRVLTELLHLDFSMIGAKNLYHELMKKVFLSMLNQPGNDESVKREMSEVDWQQINEAKQLIDGHPGKHFTIPEISKRIGINEYKLKKLFPMVTGFKVDEYRKYQLCINAGKKLIQMQDEPLKNFYAEAGYTSLTTFVRGFRKLCCCTPGELREDHWDLTALTASILMFLLGKDSGLQRSFTRVLLAALGFLHSAGRSNKLLAFGAYDLIV